MTLSWQPLLSSERLIPKGKNWYGLPERFESAHQTLLVDLGTGALPSFQPDLSREAVLQAAGGHLEEVLLCGDRGRCVEAMAHAAPVVTKQWFEEGKIDGVISMGGGGGTSMSTAAMRALPVGFPKVMITTMASGDVSAYLETSDIVMMPSVVDVARPQQYPQRGHGTRGWSHLRHGRGFFAETG